MSTNCYLSLGSPWIRESLVLNRLQSFLPHTPNIRLPIPIPALSSVFFWTRTLLPSSLLVHVFGILPSFSTQGTGLSISKGYLCPQRPSSSQRNSKILSHIWLHGSLHWENCFPVQNHNQIPTQKRNGMGIMTANSAGTGGLCCQSRPLKACSEPATPSRLLLVHFSISMYPQSPAPTCYGWMSTF